MKRPEILAPAGDAAALKAAIAAGADAVYFGLQRFNARARATNFENSTLAETMVELHAHGVKGYVTLNTLIFEAELTDIEAAIRECAEAGADAIIVQDLGVARLAQAVAPTLPIHASTQMTCTDASAVRLARELGAQRVILARELSLEEIAKIRAETDTELEVFVHGALCISYSGQCLTSEAIGGRSANRGACAQACRLPYRLVVDGVLRDLGDEAFLLSPEDLEAASLVPQLLALGVSSLKIEGRLKGPQYVAATTRLYRAAVDAALSDTSLAPNLLPEALLTYSRGSGTGFFLGADHQRLVDGHTCDHRGLTVGQVRGAELVRGKTLVTVQLSHPLARGAGVLIEGGWGNDGEVGGRVWTLTRRGQDVEHAEAGDTVQLWLGPERTSFSVADGRRLFLTDDPVVDKAILAHLDRQPHREPLDLRVGAHQGRLQLEARSERGLSATILDAALVPGTRPLTTEVLRDKLGRLGDTPFVLRQLEHQLPADQTVPLSALNQARRNLVAALLASARRGWPTTAVTASDLIAAARPPQAPPPGGLFVLCRTEAQANAALDAGADGVYLDFLALDGLKQAFHRLRERSAWIGLAPPRIRKAGEAATDRFLANLAPDALLVRGLGALWEAGPIPRIGDFSLNVTHRLSAKEVLDRGCLAFTPAFDLDAQQLALLLQSPFGPWAELVLHHPMPLFHMEHCVIAATLSEGRDFRTCGRPCDHHQLSLRDRAGMDHPVEADVACRNTVFHAAAQSAAEPAQAALASGVRRFRIELVREDAPTTRRLVQTYRQLLSHQLTPTDLFRQLKTKGGYGVVRGSLRVLENA